MSVETTLPPGNETCPMGGLHGVFRMWATSHRMQEADIGYRRGVSCPRCHKTWTTWEHGAAVWPWRPTHAVAA